MRIFVSDVRELLACGADKSDLARDLLAYAVRETWGCDMPEIRKDEKGKPYFVGAENMHFSLSHTKSHVLAAVDTQPVGADIESLRPRRGGTDRLFSPEMLADFGYFGGWTLREAVFKLRGEGSLRRTEIRLRSGVIVTPYEGVCCRCYEHDGCAIAAATYGDSFPELIKDVDSVNFCTWSA